MSAFLGKKTKKMSMYFRTEATVLRNRQKPNQNLF